MPAIHQDRELFLDVCVWFPLKSQYAGGIILNYLSRRAELAKKLGISESNLRMKVNRLIKRGLCTLENRNLRFISSKRFCELLGVPFSRGYEVNQFNAKEISDYLKSLTIDHNEIKQRHTVKKKYAKVQKVGCNNRVFKIKLEAFIQRGEQYKGVNPNITVSRKGIATLMNRKSATTGTRIAKRLKAKGLITDTPEYKRVLKCSFEDFLLLKSKHEKWFLLKYIDGHLCERTCNTVRSTLNKPSKIVPFLAEMNKIRKLSMN